jgi:menaquinone-dependent protoporphyrinogen oxidase
MSLALNDSADTRQQMATILAAVQAQVSTVVPIDQGLFAGALDYNRMSPLMRVMYRVFSEDVTSGDFRNWDAIRQWAQALAPRLLRPATVGLPRGIGRMN